MRVGGFPAPDEELDEAGLRRALTRRIDGCAWLTSPDLAARQTTEALHVTAEIEDALRDIDHGAWTGSSFEAVQAADPEGLVAWLADPARGAPGGESLEDVRGRIAPWLRGQAHAPSPVVAVTHPMVIRAVIAEALDMPFSAALRIDIAPLATVALSFNRLWRLQAIRPDEGAAP